ncbi:MAG: DUF2723 domain-containing protein [Chloroflexi bacterium]|nr:DUF2723 domain-containing protein [Ardenticatenaceae bacterium]MBL1129045.1 DUF2723 domain-containing protein [Chloroflexota bacterium]NOG35124.1 DUF2723 domain-containing protein [Chloroflexota bacterium]GIK58233.1 MAG: hypothetical protein BroJett015_38960 [Chloroflexota bacterium]
MNFHPRLAFLVLLLIVFLSYLFTLAQTPVYGDPTEYTFVAHMLGIAHPPGYAFTTLMGKLIQTIVPIGSIAWRMHLLAALSGTLAALFVFGTAHTATKNLSGWQPKVARNLSGLRVIAALFAGLSVGTAVNHWQHSIHANPHIITATFLLANLYFLTRWWAANDQTHHHSSDRWLYTFCLSAGLGVTHHPLTVFGFVGYALFILVARPSILRNWKTLLKMLAFALLGLMVWLYFPIRSPMNPGFGPTTMNTLDGFLAHVLARGLTESLPTFPLAELPHRQLVFWTLLRLQYTLPTILLAIFGFVWLIWVSRITSLPPHPLSPSPAHLLILYTLPALGTYAFVISLRAQDIMAYLIGPLAVVGLWAGIGLFGLVMVFYATAQGRRGERVAGVLSALITLTFFLAGPVVQFARNAPIASLRHYDEAQRYVNAVFDQFVGQGEGAVLLNDWEHMTPLWYAQWVDGRWPNPADVRPEFISTGGANPWLDAIFRFLPGGPVYLSNFRPNATAGTEFRLRPSGPFYQVLEPGDETLPPELTPAALTGADIEIVGYSLPDTAVTAGDFVPLTLAMRAPQGTSDYYVPVVQVGDGEHIIRYEFTTDSHLITPAWWSGEVIVEQFDFALPHDLPGGNYPVTVSLKNLSRDEEYPAQLTAGNLAITPQDNPPNTDHLLANFRQRVGLVGAMGWDNGQIARAPWSNSIAANPGDVIHLVLEWESLAKAEESYTVFVHLIDGNNVPHVALDYTPLGGSAPTHLWIPKWLPGQRLLDPYRLVIPPDLPPGDYWIEVGLYEMVNGRRLHISDNNGNLNGDRFILGQVKVRQ